MLVLLVAWGAFLAVSGPQFLPRMLGEHSGWFPCDCPAGPLGTPTSQYLPKNRTSGLSAKKIKPGGRAECMQASHRGVMSELNGGEPPGAVWGQRP